MMNHVLTSPQQVYRSPSAAWVSFAVAACVFFITFRPAIVDLIRIWDTQAEYSFGYAIPFISLFLVWQRKDRLERVAFTGSWAGLAMVLAGLVLFAIGRISTLDTIAQYALLLTGGGFILSLTGWQAFRVILVPLCMLAFMVPLPNYFLRELSQLLQLVSSRLGVEIIRLFGISVFLEGNVIDLGAMKLQVVEACSGLRYLFPLMTLGFIATYFYQEKFWKRALIVLSTIPITVLMNSVRLGLIGVTVEYWGKSMAEGVLHDFEGWFVFMVCTGAILLEMWLVTVFSRPRRPLREVFGIDPPAPTPAGARRDMRTLPRPYVVALAAIAAAAVATSFLPGFTNEKPQRRDFQEFPLEIGKWRGRTSKLESIYLNELRLDDYILADYVDASSRAVNFYVSYYASQANGNSAHSPRACIPGDGWEISDFSSRQLDDVKVAGKPVRVNRAVIQKGEHKQLVYYWFQQRGRVVTDEYAVKLYIFWDALARNRTDGAMVRLVAPLVPGESIEAVDARLNAFAAEMMPRLDAYIPA